MLYTIGHSTRPLDALINILDHYGIKRVFDVRTIPQSRYNPQFNKETFADALQKAGLEYRHMSALGGLRKPLKESINSGWKNGSFRGYADYMQTKAFEEAVQELIRLAEEKNSVLLCAEAVPWKCHRSLIADALLIRGIEVRHILTITTVQAHLLTPFAKAEGQKITYPG